MMAGSWESVDRPGERLDRLHLIDGAVVDVEHAWAGGEPVVRIEIGRDHGDGMGHQKQQIILSVELAAALAARLVAPGGRREG